MTFIGIIPARYASSRFPGKPLADICGMSMIERVYRQASKELDDVFVATDDIRIADAVRNFGGRVVMTSTEHKSGTDRCREAYENIGSDADVVINIQGDEPFIDPTQMADLNYPPIVPFDADMNALYFSRSIIPYVRNHQWEEWIYSTKYYTHVGMYAYRAQTLSEITKLPQSSLELAESLEQLRWLQNGYKIRVGITKSPTIGIDTPEDLERAIEFCRSLENR